MFIGRRNRRRNSIKNIQCCVIGYHRFNSTYSKNIRYLMWVSNHCCDPMRQYCFGKFTRNCHRTFNMHMNINQPRNHVLTLSINHFLTFKWFIITNIIKFIFLNINILFFKTLCKCIINLYVFDELIHDNIS